MITTTIERTGTQSIADWLGDGGKERTATWPAFTATFVHAESGEIVGHRVYTLRDRSAFDMMGAIKADAHAAAQQLADTLSELEAVGFDSTTLDGVDHGAFWDLAAQ